MPVEVKKSYGEFLVFPGRNVYNKYNSVCEWNLKGMAILRIRGRQRVYVFAYCCTAKRKEY